MGLVSLFSSCVDGEYYDLYEDEEEFLSPLSKKGKGDLPGDIDFSDYPMMNLGWETAECVAICYSNIFNQPDKAICRWHVIDAAYGGFNETNYYTYFSSVIFSNGVPDKAVKKLFGRKTFSVQKLAKYCKANNVGSYYPVVGNNWAVLANASSGPGTHIAQVTSLSVTPYGDEYDVTIRISDINGTDHPRYHLRLDKDKKFLRDNGDIEHFIGTCNY